VIAGDSIVRAVGTAFSVRLRDSEQIEVAVMQGRVAISSAGFVTTLKSQVSAGEVARAKHGGVVVATAENAELKRRLAWEQGELVFKKERLADVVAEFNRYNHRRLVIGDAQLEDLEVGGNFKSTDLDSFVSAVTHTMNIRADESEGVIHLLTK
jgi:transmembrane sensor